MPDLDHFMDVSCIFYIRGGNSEGAKGRPASSHTSTYHKLAVLLEIFHSVGILKTIDCTEKEEKVTEA